VLAIVRPGDVLVVRKEYAATNYFLPGYWPHAAVVLGSTSVLEQIAPGVSQRSIATTANEVLVIESMKDGVRVRSIDSPLASDSVVIVRPSLASADIDKALARSLTHEGKPYDFDFDFTCSHRMVCTEVVYRAYDGVADVAFSLSRHVGRYALAAGDLLRMALARQHFSIVAVYAPAHSETLEQGDAAAQIVAAREAAPR
jgi:uncharacterized protein YycO